jgi:hypothetical protein
MLQWGHAFAEVGTVVAVIGSYSAKIKATGKTISTPVANVWTVENGR